MILNDNYKEAIDLIHHAYILCCGGHYEPYSDRDYELSIILQKLLQNLGELR
jgi:hypothetical protein